MEKTAVSVIVPTRNRCESLTRLLRALDRSESLPGTFEVIVVDDGSTHGDQASVTRQRWSFPLRLLTQAQAGAAAARNAGARAAAGEILVFLDDDVEPEGGLIAAHVRAHAGTDSVVGLGDLPPVVNDTTFFGVILRSWWEAMQGSLRQTGHRQWYQDLLSGHFSICRARFEQLGGFSEAMRCREDYELGWRALCAGLELRFVPDAVARHFDSTDLSRACRRKFDEGIADVQLLQRHPQLGRSLPLARMGERGRVLRLLTQLAWMNQTAGDAAVATLTRVLSAYEAARLRTKWKRTLNALLGYWYARGVAQATGTRAKLDALVAAAPQLEESAFTLDLAEGLEAAEARLDALRPRAVRLRFGPYDVSDIKDVPGAEPLRGAHLRPLLATALRTEYLRAVARAGAVPSALKRAADVEAQVDAGPERGAVAA